MSQCTSPRAKKRAAAKERAFYLLPPELIEKVAVQAARERVWPNVIVERFLRIGFSAEASGRN